MRERELRTQFETNGYLHLPGILSRKLIMSIQTKIFQQLQEFRLDPKATASQKTGLTDIELDRLLKAVRKLGYDLNLLEIIGEDQKLTSILAILLNSPEIFVHPRMFLRVGVPHNDHPMQTTALHQDHRYVQGSLDTITAWIPLGDYLPTDGTLMIFPGSHSRGLMNIVQDKEASFAYSVDNTDSLGAPVCSEVRMGDCILFHSLTVHGASPNLNGKLRFSVDMRFQREDHAFSNAQLLPPFEGVSPEDSTNPRIWSRCKNWVTPSANLLESSVPHHIVSIRGKHSLSINKGF